MRVAFSLPGWLVKLARIFMPKQRLQAAQQAAWHHPRFALPPEHPVELAFVHNGIAYYCFTNELMMPTRRMLAATAAYNDLERRMGAEELKAYVAAALKAVQKADVVTAGKWLQAIEERAGYAYDEELVYRLAAVMYFDESENPNSYDDAYAEVKIKRWRVKGPSEGGQIAEPLAVFTEMPGADLLPRRESWPVDLETYSRLAKAQKMQHYQRLIRQLSSDASMRPTVDWLSSQIVTLANS